MRARAGKGVARQRTLGLASLLPRGGQRGFHVLDLGAASPANLDFLSRFEAKISIADFYEGLGGIRSKAGTEEAGADFGSLFPHRGEERFDVVLAWDLLNYLHPDELQRFMDSLAPFCRPGTSLHAFIYTTKDMPAAPIRYRIEDEKSLVYDETTTRHRPCPRYHEQELVKRLAGFAVESRFQLRNATIEYVFSFRLSQKAVVEAAASPKPSSSRTFSSRASPGRSPWERAPRWRPAPSR